MHRWLNVFKIIHLPLIQVTFIESCNDCVPSEGTEQNFCVKRSYPFRIIKIGEFKFVFF